MGITRGDKNVFRVQWIPADECQAIHRLHHFTRPAILDAINLRKAMARPALERSEALVGVVLLTGLVIFAANNQNVVSLGAFTYSLYAQIVIRIGSVPVESARNRPMRNACANNISLIGSLFGMYGLWRPTVDKRKVASYLAARIALRIKEYE
jgi:hypothetical protein